MRQKKGKLNKSLYHLCVCVMGLIMIYPLLWTVASSFKKSSTIYQTVTQLIPKDPTIENYINGWAGFSGYLSEIQCLLRLSLRPGLFYLL